MINTFRVILFLMYVGAITRSVAQTDVSPVTVSGGLLRKHVYFLASDSLRGRETGTDGQVKAANYCIRTFRQSHLIAPFRIDSVSATYRQFYAFTTTEVAPFGRTGVYDTKERYKLRELAPLPSTAEDSSRVQTAINVGGLLIGTDLKKEILVLSAHYDHLGCQGTRIFHGADDNASGTAVVMGVAAAFDSLAQLGIRPRRSVLFLLFSGEEDGLLGSRFFVYNSPVQLQQIKGVLNVDMVGRIDFQHKRIPDYCYLIGNEQANSFKKLADRANRQSVGLSLNREGYDTKNDPEFHFKRSDQYSFAAFGIPAVLFTSGSHIDYHRPTDTADRIEYNVLQKRATLIFQTVWAIANEGRE
ncbi:hypothetical protein DYU11_28220 [Fibrisoma montanum]|uniref:Peptidase M28 domain-containing protein n=1 Tax=Fibrisoma montanum TaxID=2305895 RepID=A0A418LYK9_9BACT|nr:M28 family peptidase [Fibrisoma montanum]RIV18463.1 hypothetical protein DYU11_28220 [Fibrisoma montanum]